MKHVAATRFLFAATVFLTFALPALAGEPTPLPAVGDMLTPSPRLLCTKQAALPAIFDGITDPARIKARVEAAKLLAVNGLPLCGFVEFGKPVTAVAVDPIGRIDFANGQSARAYAVTLRFDDGDELYALWFAAIAGKET